MHKKKLQRRRFRDILERCQRGLHKFRQQKASIQDSNYYIVYKTFLALHKDHQIVDPFTIALRRQLETKRHVML